MRLFGRENVIDQFLLIETWGVCCCSCIWQVYYEETIEGELLFGAINNLKGIKVKQLFIWVEVTGVHVDPDSPDFIYFETAILNKKLPTSLFDAPPTCHSESSTDVTGFSDSTVKVCFLINIFLLHVVSMLEMIVYDLIKNCLKGELLGVLVIELWNFGYGAMPLQVLRNVQAKYLLSYKPIPNLYILVCQQRLARIKHETFIKFWPKIAQNHRFSANMIEVATHTLLERVWQILRGGTNRPQ